MFSRADTDACIQRIVLVLLLHLILVMGWLLAAEHINLWLLVFVFIQLEFAWNDIKYWNHYFLVPTGIYQFIPVMMWMYLITKQFPVVSIFFCVLQFLCAFRGEWCIGDPRAANDN